MQNKPSSGGLQMKWFNKICQFFINLKQKPQKEAEEISLEKSQELKFIICNGEKQPIDWPDVITFDDTEGLLMPRNCYRKPRTERNPTMFVAHWDVCLSSKSCFNVLKKRRLSVHFCIDNDGTIYQLMDCNNVAWHAGNRKVNDKSIGVEISNAYYPKYQDMYRSQGFGPRPWCHDVEVHGKKLPPFLGFYPVQVEAFKVLAKTLHKVYNIPLVVPMKEGNLSTTIVSDVQQATFKGVVNHYNISSRKIDCAGFKLDKILKEIP